MVKKIKQWKLGTNFRQTWVKVKKIDQQSRKQPDFHDILPIWEWEKGIAVFFLIGAADRKGSKELKSRNFSKGTSRVPTECTYLISILGQFGGELCEEKTQKVRKSDQKPTSLRSLRGNMGLKNWDPQKVHLEYLLNIHT